MPTSVHATLHTNSDTVFKSYPMFTEHRPEGYTELVVTTDKHRTCLSIYLERPVLVKLAQAALTALDEFDKRLGTHVEGAIPLGIGSSDFEVAQLQAVADAMTLVTDSICGTKTGDNQ